MTYMKNGIKVPEFRQEKLIEFKIGDTDSIDCVNPRIQVNLN